MVPTPQAAQMQLVIRHLRVGQPLQVLLATVPQVWEHQMHALTALPIQEQKMQAPTVLLMVQQLVQAPIALLLIWEQQTPAATALQAALYQHPLGPQTAPQPLRVLPCHPTLQATQQLMGQALLHHLLL